MIHEEEEETKDRTPNDDKPPGLEKTFKNFQMKKGIFIEKKRSLDTNDEIFEKINKQNLIQSAMYENYINKTPSTSESGLLMRSPNLLDVLSASLTIKTPFLQNKLEDELISKVLYVKGFSNKALNVHHIYNLFSNFGEIRKIILIRVKEIGLIEFENIEYAKTAKEFLNNLFYLSDYLKVN